MHVCGEEEKSNFVGVLSPKNNNREANRLFSGVDQSFDRHVCQPPSSL
jgi:hypothetical protein